MKRQEKRRVRQREIKGFKSSTSPLTIFDEDLGISTEYLLGKCANCNKKSLVVLDKDSFFCLTCEISQVESPYMKKVAAGVKKYGEKREISR